MDFFKSKVISFALEILMALITIINKQNQQQHFYKHLKNQIPPQKFTNNQNKKKFMKKKTKTQKLN